MPRAAAALERQKATPPATCEIVLRDVLEGQLANLVQDLRGV